MKSEDHTYYGLTHHGLVPCIRCNQSPNWDEHRLRFVCKRCEAIEILTLEQHRMIADKARWNYENTNRSKVKHEE